MDFLNNHNRMLQFRCITLLRLVVPMGLLPTSNHTTLLLMLALNLMPGLMANLLMAVLFPEPL
jgi:hypothetical protein